MILKKVKNEVGATAIEYGLIASLISVLAVSGMSAVGMNLSNTYCTISKYLGGSGTCSGATSSGPTGTGGNGSPAGSGSGSIGTGGSGSAESSTGSVNSSNSLADGATIEQVKAGLKDELGTTFLPNKPYGGSNYNGYASLQSLDKDTVPNFAKSLSDINATDPVTNVFGAFDALNNGSPMTDYQTVMSALQRGGATINTGYGEAVEGLEATTASGKVYVLKSAYDGQGTVNTSEAQALPPKTP